jgi:uncharacterized membrane protein SpoIIM required for sporulation
VDIDAFVAAHRAEWGRLDALLKQHGRLSGAEADELVGLYQRVATHLSVVRSATPDPALVAKLSSLVTRARSAVTGSHAPAWKDVVLFFTRQFPAAVYRFRYWWLGSALGFLVASTAVGVWVASNPEVQATIAAPEQIRQLTRPGGDFETYYSSAPASSFAAEVFTHNALIAAACLITGVMLGAPVLLALWENALRVGAAGGLMASVGRLDVFFGLITPHGLLELTGVFVAAGTGLRLGWAVINPGPRTRAEALAAEGRTVAGMTLGLLCLFLVSGAIEAFVTPPGLPTWARISVGVAAESLFLGYVFILGRRAARAGETGDIVAAYRGDTAPTAA